MRNDEILNSVYRFLNKDNEIIYVGKAKNLKKRINSHDHLSDECYNERCKIEYLIFETEDDMDFAERYFISKIKPRYNETHKRKDITLYVPELEFAVWNTYDNVKLKYKQKQEELEEEIVLQEKKNEIKKKNNQLSMLLDLSHKNKESKVMMEIIEKERNELERDILKLERERYKIENKILKKKIGEVEYNNIPLWKRDLFISYNSTNIDEIIEMNLESITRNTLDEIYLNFEREGLFDVNMIKWRISKDLTFSHYEPNKKWLKLIDEDIDERMCYDLAGKVIINATEFVSKIYNECIRRLVINNINLKQEIIIVKERPALYGIEVDVPKLIMKVA